MNPSKPLLYAPELRAAFTRLGIEFGGFDATPRQLFDATARATDDDCRLAFAFFGQHPNASLQPILMATAALRQIDVEEYYDNAVTAPFVNYEQMHNGARLVLLMAYEHARRQTRTNVRQK